MKKLIILLTLSLFFIAGCSQEESIDKEDISDSISDGMTIEEALQIAEESDCTEKGELTNNYMYNDNSKTWWIDIEMREEFKKDYCNPACVVSEDNTVEINWRCTGAII